MLHGHATGWQRALTYRLLFFLYRRNIYSIARRPTGGETSRIICFPLFSASSRRPLIWRNAAPCELYTTRKRKAEKKGKKRVQEGKNERVARCLIRISRAKQNHVAPVFVSLCVKKKVFVFSGRNDRSSVLEAHLRLTATWFVLLNSRTCFFSLSFLLLECLRSVTTRIVFRCRCWCEKLI